MRFQPISFEKLGLKIAYIKAMKRFSLLLLMVSISATLWVGTVFSADEKNDNAPEDYDCVECTLTRGPAVVLQEDVEPAEHMEKFVAKLPVSDAKNPVHPGISRSPAIVNPQD